MAQVVALVIRAMVVLEEQMRLMVAGAHMEEALLLAVVRKVAEVEAQSVLSTPELHARSHQLVQGISNA